MRQRCSEAGWRRLGACLAALGLALACVTPTPREEAQLGAQLHEQLRREAWLLQDPVVSRYLDGIGHRIAEAAGPSETGYRFFVVVDPEVNAFAAPGGNVYVHTGTLLAARNVGELAGVLAHEVGHVDERHHVALIQRDFFFTIAVALVLGRDPGTAQIGNLLGALLNRGFSREAEFGADVAGVRLAHRAGFNAVAGLAFMERLRATEGRDPSKVEVLFRTHPALADRIVRVRSLLRELGYRVAQTAARG